MEESKKPKNKKKIIIGVIAVIAFIILIIAFASGGNKNKAENTVSQTITTSAQAQKTEKHTNKAVGTVSTPTTSSITEDGSNTNKTDGIQEIKLGQTVSTEDYDFTLNKVELSYRVEPDYKPKYYHYYDAPENEVYIYVNASVKNKRKTSVDCDTIYTATADYNDGYTYDGFHIADDHDGDFTYANITDINPLQTLGVHCLISCPEEVETSDAPLFVTIKIRGGEEYKYTIR